MSIGAAATVEKKVQKKVKEKDEVLDLTPFEIAHSKKNFTEFYPYYLSEHLHPGTKLMHFSGTALGSLWTLYVIYTNIVKKNHIYSDLVNRNRGLSMKFLILSLFFGYGFAWTSHEMIEKNKPVTRASLKCAFWSFLGDYKMAFEILQGKHSINPFGERAIADGK